MRLASLSRVRVSHPDVGCWVGAVDDFGVWVSLVPEAFEHEVARCLPAANPRTQERARVAFSSWCEAGEVPPLRLEGSAFRRGVWEALSRIPRGCVMTYGEVAQAMGFRSARAVGGAVGANPVGLFIPCHRVVGAGGVLGGYAWGADLKRRILASEGVFPK